MGQVVRSWWEETGEEEMVPRDFPPFSPLPATNLELTRAGREVAESSHAPPRPPKGSHSSGRGCRHHWTGLTCTWWVRGSPSAGGLWPGRRLRDRGVAPPMGPHVAGQLGRVSQCTLHSLHRMRSTRMLLW